MSLSRRVRANRSKRRNRRFGRRHRFHRPETLGGHAHLAWFEDVMDILKSHGIGYALWNFRGPFGILDSGRKEIAYEDRHGPNSRRCPPGVLQLLSEFGLLADEQFLQCLDI